MRKAPSKKVLKPVTIIRLDQREDAWIISQYKKVLKQLDDLRTEYFDMMPQQSVYQFPNMKNAESKAQVTLVQDLQTKVYKPRLAGYEFQKAQLLKLIKSRNILHLFNNDQNATKIAQQPRTDIESKLAAIKPLPKKNEKPNPTHEGATKTTEPTSSNDIDTKVQQPVRQQSAFSESTTQIRRLITYIHRYLNDTNDYNEAELKFANRDPMPDQSLDAIVKAASIHNINKKEAKIKKTSAKLVPLLKQYSTLAFANQADSYELSCFIRGKDFYMCYQTEAMRAPLYKKLPLSLRNPYAKESKSFTMSVKSGAITLSTTYFSLKPHSNKAGVLTTWVSAQDCAERYAEHKGVYIVLDQTAGLHDRVHQVYGVDENDKIVFIGNASLYRHLPTEIQDILHCCNEEEKIIVSLFNNQLHYLYGHKMVKNGADLKLVDQKQIFNEGLTNNGATVFNSSRQLQSPNIDKKKDLTTAQCYKRMVHSRS